MVSLKLSPKIIFPTLIILIFAGMLFFWQRSISKSSSQKSKTTPIEELAKPTATSEINRTFEFKIKDPKNQPIVLKFTLVSAKKVQMITINNQPINLKADEEIMVLSIELQNDSNYGLKVSSQDFIRLLNGDKKYAADMYNDSVDLPAISVKKDEIAFIVSKNQKQFKLQVGEIDKEKTEIDIDF